jgi:hypothetical protein
MRGTIVLRFAASLVAALTLSACGGSSSHGPSSAPAVTQSSGPGSSSSGTSTSAVSTTSGSGTKPLPFPTGATKNTTRVDSSDPVVVAAAVALAVFPSALPGTHPAVVAIAPTDSWQAALAAASLMSSPFRAPLLLSTSGDVPLLTARALASLAPTGSAAAGGAQLIAVGDIRVPSGYRVAQLSGSDPYSLAAAIDRFEIERTGTSSRAVIVASSTQPQYAMPAGGLAAESGTPILYVNAHGVPTATKKALALHNHPHIYVLGPASAVPDAVLAELGAYGPVARVGAASPAANSVLLAEYRNPPCTYGQACTQVPGSFGWAIRSPGHGYVLISQSSPLDAAAAAPLSASGSYGPQLLVENPNTLPGTVLNYFLNYATPGYAQQGPTSAVYNHAWLIGTTGQISLGVQAQVDSLLEAVAQK